MCKQLTKPYDSEKKMEHERNDVWNVEKQGRVSSFHIPSFGEPNSFRSAACV